MARTLSGTPASPAVIAAHSTPTTSRTGTGKLPTAMLIAATATSAASAMVKTSAKRPRGDVMARARALLEFPDRLYRPHREARPSSPCPHPVGRQPVGVHRPERPAACDHHQHRRFGTALRDRAALRSFQR